MSRLLVTNDQCARYKMISSSPHALKSLDRFLEEAQNVDLEPILGDTFLEDLQEDPEKVKYPEVLKKIVPLLVYLSYARYLVSRNVVDTPFGMVQKESEFSTPVSDKTLLRMITQTREVAKYYEEKLIKFLQDNKTDYPLWRGCHDIPSRTGSIRITKIH